MKYLFSRYLSTDYYGPVPVLDRVKRMSKTHNSTDLIELII